ncbi:MAG: selenium-dependent molybdenum cofactor biosynthesis protein YqeB [bacterium]
MGRPFRVWVRGAGELASAVGVSLHRSGFHVWLSELPEPLAIRRTVTFSDAVFEGEAEVEDVRAVFCEPEAVEELLGSGEMPLVLDDPTRIRELQPNAVVDARMRKRDDSELRSLAPFTVGVGPGFAAGTSCDCVIETMRGHNLGRIIWEGSASADTGVPGNIGGETARRVVYSPVQGKVVWSVKFGDLVEEGQLLGRVEEQDITAPLRGMVRGLISPRVFIPAKTKIADVDPRGASVDFTSISDKARSVGRAVLEAMMIHRARHG